MVDTVKWGKIEDLWDNPPKFSPWVVKKVISKIVDWKHCCGLGNKGHKEFLLRSFVKKNMMYTNVTMQKYMKYKISIRQDKITLEW